MDSSTAPVPTGLMTSTAQEARASRNGARRTIFYTKKLPDGKEGEEKKYARTHQYLGEWKDNKWHGKGTLEKADGSRYVGEWKAGKRDGVGTLWHRHADGSLRKVYTGLWVDDMQQGRGTLNYKPGDVYIGDWVRGQRAGSGICTYADGGVYEGEWLDDKRHGFGVYDYKSGERTPQALSGTQARARTRRAICPLALPRACVHALCVRACDAYACTCTCVAWACCAGCVALGRRSL